MIVQYTAPIHDNSGYACAARNNVVAMVRAGINLTVRPLRFENIQSNHGELGKTVNNLVNCYKNFDIDILHCTPENWPRLINTNKYTIGYTTWETDTLPKNWAALINSANEIWVPSTWNKEVFIVSGVTKPIHVVPHPIDVSLKDKKFDCLKLPLEDHFKFYSIFQWTERKNPLGLLKAFLTKFKPEHKVCLVLKTYHMGWGLDQQQFIKQSIATLKQNIGNKEYPPIIFLGELLNDEEVYSLHQQCDCLVAPHRGEGFGVPIQEAMLFGKPIITTNWSGSLEFTNNKNAYLLDYKLVPVGNMPWAEKYTPDQKWAEPEYIDEMMWTVYTNSQHRLLIAKQAQEDIVNGFSHETIGKLIASLLKKE